MTSDTQKLPAETEQNNTLLLNHCIAEHPHCDIEKLKAHYFNTAHKNPLAIEYTISEIDIIDKHLEKKQKAL